METYIIWIKDEKYILDVKTYDEDGTMTIKIGDDSFWYTILYYIPCSDVRFDYKIIVNLGLKTTMIENILELFTKQVINNG